MNLVSGHGPSDAKVILVGDSPSNDDVVSGYALTGSTEWGLNSMFRPFRYDVKQFYRTLYIKTKLKYTGKQKKLYNEAIREALKDTPRPFDEILAEEIAFLAPTVVVPLDNLSLNHLAGLGPITNYRGSVLPLRTDIQSKIGHPVKVIPVYHPQRIRQDPPSRIYSHLDYKKVIDNINNYGVISVNGRVFVCRVFTQFLQWLNRMRTAVAELPSEERFMVFDIETFLGFPTAIGFCFDGEEALSIPINDGTISRDEMTLFIHEIARLLASPIDKVNQNIKFDCKQLEKFGFHIQNVAGDTALAFHTLYPELPKNLGFQVSIYTDFPYFKDESGKKASAWNPKNYVADTLYIYNGKDALSTHQIYSKQLKELKEDGLIDFYRRQVPLIHLYKKMEGNGLRVSEAQRDYLRAKYETLYEGCRLELRDLVGEELNPRSGPQVGHLVYETLKFPPRTKTTDSGKTSWKTDKDTLDDLVLKYPEKPTRALKLIITLRKLSKIIEFCNIPLYPDGTFRGEYNLIGTETGRTSGSKTLDQIFVREDNEIVLKRMGGSLQTLTKHGYTLEDEVYDTPEDAKIGHDLRSMFVPRTGYVFVEGDLSQADARTVCVLCKDYELLSSFDTKPKIHAKTAGYIFGVDPFKITKSNPVIPGLGIAYYDLGKRARHAGSFGMGPFRLAQMTHLPLKQCEDILFKYHEREPNVRHVYHKEVFDAILRDRTLVTPFGRRRVFYGRFDSQTEKEKLLKEAYSYVPQSVTSDALKFGILSLYEEVSNFANFLVEAHDSLLSEVLISEKERYCDLFRKHVEKPINFTSCTLSRDFNLTIPCELSEGQDWMNMNEI